MKKGRKPRGLKLDGTMSQDMCEGCIAFGCDPMAMSHKFQDMKAERYRLGQCVACGQVTCICKSSLSLPKLPLGEAMKKRIDDDVKARRAVMREKLLKRLEEKKNDKQG